MKKLYLVLLSCCATLLAYAQPVVAINPTGSGGFETGTTYTANGFSAVNPPSFDNQWLLGNAAGVMGGSRAAYISGNGSTWGYQANGPRASHFFYDHTYPPTATNIVLGFYWKATVNPDSGRLFVSVTNTGAAPFINLPGYPSTFVIAGPPPIANPIWTQPATASAYTLQTINIPAAAVAGTTSRIIFTWQSGNRILQGSPAAIDNISLNYCVFPSAIRGRSRYCTTVGDSLWNDVPGGTWSTSNSSVATIDASGRVTAVSPGTVTITYTNACGTVTRSDTVISFPNPIVGRDTVCVGDQTGFASVTLGGTWSSAFPAVASVLTGSGLITGHNSGITPITYTMVSGSGCYRVRDMHVVNPPPPITGASVVCQGRTITLSNPTSGGTWMSQNPGGATVGSTNGVVTGVTGDTATIIYTSPAGCRQSKVIDVNPSPPPISGSMAKCIGATDTLYDSAPGGNWTSSSTGIATINSSTGIITAVSSGIATITYTFPSTTCFTTKTVTVYPAPTPVVNYDSWSQTFYTDTVIYSAYQWYHSTLGIIPGATTWRTAGVYTGAYYVEVSDLAGCIGKSSSYPFNAATVGVAAAATPLVSVTPNPVRNHVFINAPVEVRAVITSVDGRTEMQQENARSMDISRLPAGVHFLNLYNSENGKLLKTEKLIRE